MLVRRHRRCRVGVLDLDPQPLPGVEEAQHDLPPAVHHGVGDQLGDHQLGARGARDAPGLTGPDDGVPGAADGLRLARQRPPATPGRPAPGRRPARVRHPHDHDRYVVLRRVGQPGEQLLADARGVGAGAGRPHFRERRQAVPQGSVPTFDQSIGVEHQHVAGGEFGRRGAPPTLAEADQRAARTVEHDRLVVPDQQRWQVPGPGVLERPAVVPTRQGGEHQAGAPRHPHAGDQLIHPVQHRARFGALEGIRAHHRAQLAHGGRRLHVVPDDVADHHRDHVR